MTDKDTEDFVRMLMGEPLETCVHGFTEPHVLEPYPGHDIYQECNGKPLWKK